MDKNEIVANLMILYDIRLRTLDLKIKKDASKKLSDAGIQATDCWCIVDK